MWNWRACNMGGQISFITAHVCFADIAHTEHFGLSLACELWGSHQASGIWCVGCCIVWQDTFSLNLRNKLKKICDFFIFILWIDVDTTGNLKITWLLPKLKNCVAAATHIVCVCIRCTHKRYSWEVIPLWPLFNKEHSRKLIKSKQKTKISLT
jgi:hypothetical protein